MDFTISSTTGTDTLSAYNLQLLITPIGTPMEDLQFTPTTMSQPSQPVPYGNSNYVFYGASSMGDLMLPVWGLPTPTNYNNDTISGGDSDDGSGLGYVTITSSFLLVSVQFFAPIGSTPGDQFQISLVPGANTYLDDASGSAVPSFQYVGGIVTVSSVPEPSSLVLAGIAGLGGLLVYRRNRRRSA
jgi:hypothetical protein